MQFQDGILFLIYHEYYCTSYRQMPWDVVERRGGGDGHGCMVPTTCSFSRVPQCL